MNCSKVSIIIPVSREKIECLDILLKQTYKNFEIILIPDEPLGNKFEKEKRIKIIRCQTRNVSKKRNVGIKASKGEIIAFIDDDAIPEKNWVEKGVEFLEYGDCVSGPTLPFPNQNTKQKISDELIKNTLFRKKFSEYNEKTNFVITTYKEFSSCNAFIKKSVLKTVPGFNEKIGYPSEDVELFYLLGKKHKLIFADNPVIHRRREFPIGHFKQIFSWAKKDAELCFAYQEILYTKEFLVLLFAPILSILLIGLLFLSMSFTYSLYVFVLIFGFYFMYELYILSKTRDIKLYLFLLIGVPLHQMAAFCGFWYTLLSLHKWNEFRALKR